jgi:hypothetical protein
MLRCDLSAAAVGGCEGSCGGTDVVWGQVEHRRCVGSCSTRSAGATDGAGAGIRQKRLAFRHSHAHFPIPTVKKLLLLWLFSLSIKQKKRKKMEGNENNRGRTVPSIWNRLIHIYTKCLTVGIITSYSFHNQHIERDRTIPSAFTLKTKHTVAL